MGKDATKADEKWPRFDQIDPAFRYLDALRDSGVTNMWGSAPYLAKYMHLSIERASKLGTLWMGSFARAASDSLSDRIAWACQQDDGA